MHVDQPGRKDAPVVAEGAGVTFVMPVLNERAYLRRAVETVLAQDVGGPTELILALAPSTDGTTADATEEDDSFDFGAKSEPSTSSATADGYFTCCRV